MLDADSIKEFKAILLKDYGMSVDDKTAMQLATDFLTSLEAIISGPKVDKFPRRSKSND